jgi:predicted transposase/invertase (TIGR01784 family)
MNEVTADVGFGGDDGSRKVKRNHKDNLFAAYFKEPGVLLDALSAIDGESYPADSEVVINTLENVLYKGVVNDISFVLNRKLIVLIESQTTLSENFPLRFLMYVANLYERHVASRNVYKRGLVKIPRPEFIVLYNGLEKCEDMFVQRLSDAFEDVESPDILELSLRVYNINKGRNPEMLARSKALSDYSDFLHMLHEVKKRGEILEIAVPKIVEYCKQSGIMADFLEKHGGEVINMLYTEWNLDDALEVGREEALEEGIEIGTTKGIEITARKMKGEGLDTALISKVTGLSRAAVADL